MHWVGGGSSGRKLDGQGAGGRRSALLPPRGTAVPCRLARQRSARATGDAPSPSPCWRTSGVRESWGVTGSGFRRGSGRWGRNPGAEALGRGLTPARLGANKGFETRGPRSRTGAISEKGVENSAPLPSVCVPAPRPLSLPGRVRAGCRSSVALLSVRAAAGAPSGAAGERGRRRRGREGRRPVCCRRIFPL